VGVGIGARGYGMVQEKKENKIKKIRKNKLN